MLCGKIAAPKVSGYFTVAASAKLLDVNCSNLNPKCRIVTEGREIDDLQILYSGECIDGSADLEAIRGVPKTRISLVIWLSNVAFPCPKPPQGAHNLCMGQKAPRPTDCKKQDSDSGKGNNL